MFFEIYQNIAFEFVLIHEIDHGLNTKVLELLKMIFLSWTPSNINSCPADLYRFKYARFEVFVIYCQHAVYNKLMARELSALV